MSTIQEQLQQVKQQMGQQGKQSGAVMPADKRKQSGAQQKATRATEKDAAPNP